MGESRLITDKQKRYLKRLIKYSHQRLLEKDHRECENLVLEIEFKGIDNLDIELETSNIDKYLTSKIVGGVDLRLEFIAILDDFYTNYYMKLKQYLKMLCKNSPNIWLSKKHNTQS